jgi:hypothetical protein
MSKYIKIGKLVLLAVAVGVVCYYIADYRRLKADNDVMGKNYKALMEQYDELDAENYEMMFTLEDYNYYSDSLLERLRMTQEELDIKDKQLRYVQSLNTTLVKYDTVLLSERDTLFVEGLCIDTTIGDRYISNRLMLEYPSRVELSTVVRSEKDVLITQERETVRPPKRCWLGRLFQRKHDVIKVHVKEHNPYVDKTEEMFIKIIE